MADAYIQLAADGAGKKSQTHSNTISAQTVHATCVVPVDTAGTALISASGTSLAVGGNVNAGAADSGSPVKAGGKYNASAPTLTDGNRGDLQLDVNGNLKVVGQDGDSTKATYYASYYVSYAGSAEDLIEIRGSASKTVRVRRIVFNDYGPAAAQILKITKRSTNSSGGTSTALTLVPADSSSAAATAEIRGYTVKATSLGTAVGIVVQRAYQTLTSSTAGNCVEVDVEFGKGPYMPIVLRGSSECLGFGFVGTPSITATEYTLSIVFTEE